MAGAIAERIGVDDTPDGDYGRLLDRAYQTRSTEKGVSCRP
jgi:hypothetical protein